MKGHCYYCGIQATSREHLPPQHIFKGFLVDGITVPSCDKHNSRKSGDDEAIVKSMLKALEKGSIALNDDVKYALEFVRPHYNQVKRLLSEHTLYRQNNTNYDFVVLNPNIDLSDWIRKLSAGLIWYKNKVYDSGNQFDHSFVFERNSYPNYERPEDLSSFEIEYKKKIEFTRILETGKWISGWNNRKYSYPETLYAFYYKFVGQKIIIKHIFYGQYTFYNVIDLSNNTILGLEQD